MDIATEVGPRSLAKYIDDMTFSGVGDRIFEIWRRKLKMYNKKLFRGRPWRQGT